jgi:hypothetical protein
VQGAGVKQREPHSPSVGQPKERQMDERVVVSSVMRDCNVKSKSVMQKCVGVIPMVVEEIPTLVLAQQCGDKAEGENDDRKEYRFCARQEGALSGLKGMVWHGFLEPCIEARHHVLATLNKRHSSRLKSLTRRASFPKSRAVRRGWSYDFPAARGIPES